MGWLRRGERPPRTPVFRQCPGCSYDFVTGEGERSCGWYDCPSLPEAFKVRCPQCDYNFATDEGEPHCDDLAACEWAEEGYAHAALALQRFETPPTG